MGQLNIRGGLISSLLLLSFNLAQADLEQTKPQQFFHQEETIKRIQDDKYQKNKDSVFQLKYASHMIFQGKIYGDPIPTGSCTNTMISDEGHFITALHCLDGCLDRYDATRVFYQALNEHGIMDDGLVGINYEKLRGKTCAALDPQTGEMIEAEFIAGGPGTNLSSSSPISILGPLLESDVKKAVTYVAYGIAGNLDFAILKRTDTKRPKSCVALTEQEDPNYLNDQLVWTLSYPSKPGWPNENLADGNTRVYAEGRVLSSYKDVPELVEFADKIKYTEKAEAKKDFLMNFDSSKITTVPATPGSSGSSVFDSENKISGVISFVFTGGAERSKQGPLATYMVNAVSIRQYVTEAYSELNVEEIFKCSQ